MKKSNTFKLICTLGITCLILGGVLLAICFPYGKTFKEMIHPRALGEISVNESLEMTDVTVIDIASRHNTIIKNGETFNVQASGNYLKSPFTSHDFKVVKSGNTISVRFDFFQFVSIAPFSDVIVNITIPADYSGDLIVETFSNDTSLDVANSLKAVKIKTVSGETNVKNLTSETMEIDTFSGKTNIAAINNSGSMEIETSSGETNIESINTLTSSIETFSGKTSIKNITSTNKTTLETSSGSSVIGNIITAEFESEVFSGDTTLKFLAPCNIKSSVSSGTMNLYLPLMENINFSAKVSSGSIYNNYFDNSPHSFENNTSFTIGNSAQAKNIKLEVFSGKINLYKVA